jgi:DNA-binding NtrC family response regulator
MAPSAFLLRSCGLSAQVLVAEDEELLRGVIIEGLQDKDIKVAGAADGIEALELLKSNTGVVLLLSDIRMPRMDGYTLVDRALEQRPELKILMMTGYAAEMPPASALHAREIRTIHKPFDLNRLSDLVLEMLARP